MGGHVFSPIFLQLVLQFALFSHCFPAQFHLKILATHAQDSLGGRKGILCLIINHFLTILTIQMQELLKREGMVGTFW